MDFQEVQNTFPFLIGRIRTFKYETDFTLRSQRFPFLIGRIRTRETILKMRMKTLTSFPFLIGRIRTTVIVTDGSY